MGLSIWLALGVTTVINLSAVPMDQTKIGIAFLDMFKLFAGGQLGYHLRFSRFSLGITP
jgi:hypothetical protein